MCIQPKCGCSTIHGWIQQQVGKVNPLAVKLNDREVLLPKYKNYEKILIVREPYQRLISYYSKFVIQASANKVWIYADKQKKFSLEEKSFKDFIYLMKDLVPSVYQHHLVPQTFGIEVNAYDTILTIKDFNQFLKQRNYTTANVVNKIKRHNYHKSIIDQLPAQIEKDKVPAVENFYNEELVKITERYIYPNDYRLLKHLFI